MPRHRAAFRRARAAVVTTVLAGLTLLLLGAVPAPSYAGRAEERTPLTVTIGGLSPSALRPRQPVAVTVTGTVTNTDEAPWEDVTVYPFVSRTPMTTTGQLTEAADTDEAAEVGERVLLEGDFARLGRIDPGQTVSFTLRVPHGDLGMTEPGVYWFGVHALGAGPDGQDNRADGRARTFLSVLPGRTAPVRAAVLMPIRAHVAHDPDGSIAGVDGWQRVLSPTGRLGRALALGTAPGGRSLSWLVDPAVLDALRRLADGNPPRDLGPTDEPTDGSSEDPSDGSASPSASPSPTASASATPEPDALTQAVARQARAWLDAMLPVLQGSEVLALPYGDLDLPAAARHDPDIYGTARTRSIAFFDDAGIAVTEVNAPLPGALSADALTMTDSATPTIVSDVALPTELAWGQDSTPVLASVGAWRLAISSSGASSGGPGPGDPEADVAMRQRILAEAAVRALGPQRSPLVVTLPLRWRPTDAAGFLAGLDQPWLQLPGLTTTLSGQLPTQVDLKSLRYFSSAAREELPADRFSRAQDLIRGGRTLQRVLARNDTVASQVVGEALTDVGYLARHTRADAPAARSWIESRLDSIEVVGPAGVTLSGSSGGFAATVVNGMDQPVTVSVRAITDNGIAVSTPKSVQVAATGRITVLLKANRAQAGVHNVTLQLVDSGGARIGRTAYVPIRAAQVSKIIWVFLGVGGALLFGAIAIRLVRRVRAARR